MTAITLMERTFEITPLKLGDLRQVAPHIDAINATAGALSTFQGMAESARSMLEVLAVAVHKVDATVTAETLEAEAGLPDIPLIGEAFKTLLEISGMAAAGEATAPSEPATGGASKRKSAKSSAS
jgi:hypothetical protein